MAEIKDVDRNLIYMYDPIVSVWKEKYGDWVEHVATDGRGYVYGYHIYSNSGEVVADIEESSSGNLYPVNADKGGFKRLVGFLTIIQRPTKENPLCVYEFRGGGDDDHGVAFKIIEDETAIPENIKAKEPKSITKSGFCYIATCVYGSYDCPEVWTLRRYRDNTLSNSWFGRQFIRLYYAAGPKIVRLFGKTKWFNNLLKPVLDKFVIKLQNNGVYGSPYSDI